MRNAAEAKIFLLSGDRGCGKSTLLLELLCQSEVRAAGFTTARILNRKGQILGFRHKTLPERAANSAEPKPQTSELLAERAEFCPPDAFLIHSNGRIFFRKEIFLQSLSAPRLEGTESPLLFFDEIGGIELLHDEIFAAWQRLFDGRKAILGVFKAEGHLDALKERAALSEAEWRLIKHRRRELLGREALICRTLEPFGSEQVDREAATRVTLDRATDDRATDGREANGKTVGGREALGSEIRCFLAACQPTQLTRSAVARDA